MRNYIRLCSLALTAAFFLISIPSCDDDDMILIEGTIPQELESHLQRFGYPYETDGAGGAYHPYELVLTLTPGLTTIELEDFLFNVFLVQSYRPCMCGDIIVLVTFSPEQVEEMGGLEGFKLSGESEDEIEQISFNYYNFQQLLQFAPTTVNTGTFESAIESAEFVVGMVDAGVDFSETSGPMFQRLHTTDTDNINGADEDGNCLTDDYLGWDFVNQDNDATDDHSHGNHVTNIIEDQLEFYDPNQQTTWRSRSAYLPVKTHDLNGVGTMFTVACGIIYAADHGANIINASWGFYSGGNAEMLRIAIEYAFAKSGTIFVVSAGNEGTNLRGIKHYPSEFDYPYIFKVGSYDNENNNVVASFSNYYPSPDENWLAPGVNISSDMPAWSSSGFAQKSGTSVSAPFVTAAVLYTMLKCGFTDASDIRSELESSFDLESIPFGEGDLLVRRFSTAGYQACP